MKKLFMTLISTAVLAWCVDGYAFEEAGLDIHGFVSQGYMKSQDNNFLANNSSDGTFEFNEFGINFSKQLTDRLRVGLQLFSSDLGAIGQNKVILDWAFGDYHWKDWLGIRLGKIKAPHGLYNETRDMDMLRTSILLPQSVYPELNRITMSSIQGIGIYGEVPAGLAGDFSYYLLAGTMDVSGDDDNGAVRQFNSNPAFDVTGDFRFDHVYVGALEWQTPLDGLMLKYTYRTSELDIPALAGGFFPVTYEIKKNSSYVYSIEYAWNDLILAGEYTQTRSESVVTLDSLGIVMSDLGVMKNHGFYISAAYRFNDRFEAGTYYSKYYADSDDKDGQNGVSSGKWMYDYQAWLEDYVLSLRFDINDYMVAKIEGHLLDGAAFCLRMDNDDFEKDWNMITAKVTFSF